MSGICAVLRLDGAPVEADLLHRMVEVAAYRGPDGVGREVLGCVAMAHLALRATPEAARERQPLRSEDGALCLVADARIDNRRETVEMLRQSGHLAGDAPTDAEVILAAYRRWGSACAGHLTGDFAFAVWDARERRLTCARDALGVKPLHYAAVGPWVCVATEAQQVLQHPAVPRRLDEVAVADYLVNNCDDEERTLFGAVRRLPPGCILVADERGVRVERYWSLDDRKRTRYRRDEEYEKHFLHLLRGAVSDRLRTEGSVVGLFMSGGLDSTSIAAMAQRELGGRSGMPALLPCSGAYPTLGAADERAYCEAMAEHLGVAVQYINGDEHWLLGDPEAFRPSLETPFLGFEGTHRRLLAAIRAQGGRVVLSGHVLGYSRIEDRSLVTADRIHRGQFGAFRDLAAPASLRGRSLARVVWEDVVKGMMPARTRAMARQALGRAPSMGVPSWVRADFARRTDLARRCREYDAAPIRPRLARAGRRRSVVVGGQNARAVQWYDRAAAQCGLEARHPYLDRRLVEFLMAIPPEQIHRPGEDRSLIRRAMAGYLPDAVRLRSAPTHFGRYVEYSLRERAADVIEQLLREPVLAETGIVDGQGLRRAFERYRSGEAAGHGLWFAITLELWLRHVADGVEIAGTPPAVGGGRRRPGTAAAGTPSPLNAGDRARAEKELVG